MTMPEATKALIAAHAMLAEAKPEHMRRLLADIARAAYMEGQLQ